MKTRLVAAAAVAVIVIVILGGYIYLFSPTTSPKLSAGSNVTVDSYPAGTAYPWTSPQGPIQGVEPVVAVAPDGSIFAAWIGLSASHPTTVANSSLQYRSQIMFAMSSDGGRTFSAPVVVSNSTSQLSYGCYDPTIGVSPNSTVAYVGYVCSVQGGGTATVVNIGVGRSGQGGAFAFVQHTVSVGLSFDRPWLQVSPSGTVYLVWDSSYLVYWTTLAPNDSRINSPSFNLFPTSYGWVSGMGLLPNGTVVVSAYGYAKPTPPPGNSTISVLVTNLSRSQAQGSLSWRNLYYLSVPSEYYRGGNDSYLPGPAIALTSGGTLYLALVANEGHSLLLTWRSAGNDSWASPVTVEKSAGSMVEMPQLAVSSSGDSVAVTWMGNSTGHWDAYATAFIPASSTVLPPVKLSSAEGFPTGVLAWHGDFMAAAFTSKSTFVVLWSDGRGVPDYYGYGHIYASVVTVG